MTNGARSAPRTPRPALPPPPPTPEWVNADGTIDESKMPETMPLIGPDGKVANGKTLKVKTRGLLNPSGAPVAPKSAPEPKAGENRTIETDEDGRGGEIGMSGGRRVLRLLEGACAVVAVLYATLLVLFTDYDALLITYRNGDLTSTITVFTGASVGWLGLRLMRSPRHPSVGLLVGGACVVGLVAVLWWTTRPAVEERHVTPTRGTGRL